MTTDKDKFLNPEYYLFRAEECLAMSETFKDLFAKQAMTLIAEDYVRMAQLIRAGVRQMIQ